MGNTPLNRPGWFDSYNAGALTRALEEGTARAVPGEANCTDAYDRIVLITETGRGYVWHQMNHCGEAAYEGDPVPADCPLRPEEL